MRAYVPLKVGDSSTLKSFTCLTRCNICVQGLQKHPSNFYPLN